MVYSDLKFPKKENGPFFFTNFVSTVDGKVQVKDGAPYWPIGSETDFQTLLDLRAYSDILIHGKNTALGFNHLGRIHSEEFKARRRNLKKTKDLEYMIIASNPDESLLPLLKNDFGAKAFIVTTQEATVAESLLPWVNILRFGEKSVDLNALANFLHQQEIKIALMEGGPTLLGSFLQADLIDEIFLTIAPKIFGNADQKTLTLVEGHLFPADKIKKLKLLSVKQIEDELYLRYSVND